MPSKTKEITPAVLRKDGVKEGSKLELILKEGSSVELDGKTFRQFMTVDIAQIVGYVVNVN